MTPKQQDKIVEVLAWICTAILIGATLFLISIL
jgi:hypothetical protein